jgi:hypothetical protein
MADARMHYRALDETECRSLLNAARGGAAINESPLSPRVDTAAAAAAAAVSMANVSSSTFSSASLAFVSSSSSASSSSAFLIAPHRLAARVRALCTAFTPAHDRALLGTSEQMTGHHSRQHIANISKHIAILSHTTVLFRIKQQRQFFLCL